MSKSIGNVVDPRTVMLGGKDQKVHCGSHLDVLSTYM